MDLNDKSILVTGGTGSFGQRFIRTVLETHSVRRVAIYSRDELKQFEMSQDPVFAGRPEVRYFIGDVRDRGRLETAMRDVDCVIHAAALKQVPAAEYNPFECIRTNVFGAENVVQAALAQSVPRIIALSTDKAVSPLNLYGASKLAADKIFVAANNMAGRHDIRFSVVRYGNVVGSRGSVVPVFRRLAAEGADSLPITDDRMTRFWITLQQGVDFVLTSLDLMHGGEIFTPKIPSMKVVDLAAVVAPDLPTRTIGIRPGEKLHEVLVTADDSRSTLEMDDRYIIEPIFNFWNRETYTEKGARTVEEGFQYDSANNDDWLTPDRLRAMLEEAGV